MSKALGKMKTWVGFRKQACDLKGLHSVNPHLLTFGRLTLGKTYNENYNFMISIPSLMILALTLILASAGHCGAFCVSGVQCLWPQLKHD